MTAVSMQVGIEVGDLSFSLWTPQLCLWVSAALRQGSASCCAELWSCGHAAWLGPALLPSCCTFCSLAFAEACSGVHV
jgi:hypothetical protein